MYSLPDILALCKEGDIIRRAAWKSTAVTFRVYKNLLVHHFSGDVVGCNSLDNESIVAKDWYKCGLTNTLNDGDTVNVGGMLYLYYSGFLYPFKDRKPTETLAAYLVL
jgi:hypothetical protein